MTECRLYDRKGLWVIVFLMNSTGDVHALLATIKDLQRDNVDASGISGKVKCVFSFTQLY